MSATHKTLHYDFKRVSQLEMSCHPFNESQDGANSLHITNLIDEK